jgi:hypothetical protein
LDEHHLDIKLDTNPELIGTMGAEFATLTMKVTPLTEAEKLVLTGVFKVFKKFSLDVNN